MKKKIGGGCINCDTFGENEKIAGFSICIRVASYKCTQAEIFSGRFKSVYESSNIAYAFLMHLAYITFIALVTILFSLLLPFEKSFLVTFVVVIVMNALQGIEWLKIYLPVYRADSTRYMTSESIIQNRGQGYLMIVYIALVSVMLYFVASRKEFRL